MLRLPLLEPHELSEAQKSLHSRLSHIVEHSYGNSFTTKDSNKSFVGPFGIVMHTPSLGETFYDTASEIGRLNGLSPRAREVAILVVGAHYASQYQLYAHTALGLRADLSPMQVQEILEGKLPGELKEEEVVAFDVASALLTEAGPLRTGLWQKTMDVLGVQGTLALTHTVGFYAYLCILLNTFDAKVPNQSA